MNGKTHFGYQEVDETEKAHKVAGVFDSVAPKYDLMNDLMSAGMHRLPSGEPPKKVRVQLPGYRNAPESVVVLTND